MYFHVHRIGLVREVRLLEQLLLGVVVVERLRLVLCMRRNLFREIVVFLEDATMMECRRLSFGVIGFHA